MLRHGGIADAKKRGEFANRALAVYQLTEDQQAVAIGQGLEQLARGIGGGLHLFDVHFHTCVYTNYRIYCQARCSFCAAHPQQQGEHNQSKSNQTEEESWRNSSFSVQASAEH